jgi:hypothetical protein
MVSADIQVVDCYIVPLQYGDLFVHVNSHNNPIKIEYYDRYTSELRLSHNYENFSTMDVDDVINDFIEPLPVEIINHSHARLRGSYTNYDADTENLQ